MISSYVCKSLSLIHYVMMSGLPCSIFLSPLNTLRVKIVWFVGAAKTDVPLYSSVVAGKGKTGGYNKAVMSLK